MAGINTGAIPATLRRANERTVLGLLARMGTASRAGLAKAAGLSQPTAGKITSDLLELGILQEVAVAPSAADAPPKVGRPGRLLRLNRETNRFLAVELDVAETRLAPLPIALLEDRWTASFPTAATPGEWKRGFKRAVAGVPKTGLWGVLVSAPGIVDEQAGRVLFSPNLHWSEGVDLPALVQSVLDLPVLLAQEIRALALGHLAANPQTPDFLLVDFGHGVALRPSPAPERRTRTHPGAGQSAALRMRRHRVRGDLDVPAWFVAKPGRSRAACAPPMACAGSEHQRARGGALAGGLAGLNGRHHRWFLECAGLAQRGDNRRFAPASRVCHRAFDPGCAARRLMGEVWQSDLRSRAAPPRRRFGGAGFGPFVGARGPSRRIARPFPFKGMICPHFGLGFLAGMAYHKGPVVQARQTIGGKAAG
jgi:hypothetical protein